MGFIRQGVDRIIADSQIPKATFYNYFHSKERLIQMSLTFQTDALKEEVFSTIYSYRELMVFDKLKRIFFYMLTQTGFIGCLLKQFLKQKSIIRRLIKWLLITETGLFRKFINYFLTVKPAATVEDAHMFLFVVDGAMVQLLSSNQTDEREYLIDYFLSRV